MAGLIAREKASESIAADHEGSTLVDQGQAAVDESGKASSFWLSPVASDEEEDHVEVVEKLLGEGIYAFGENTQGRKVIKPGDWICFYASRLGVVAHAKVKSRPHNAPHNLVRHKEKYPWTFQVEETAIYTESPVMIDETTRARLDAFKGRDPAKAWAWFVQGTGRISEHDFQILTRQEKRVSS
jgi:hypothetical protein